MRQPPGTGDMIEIIEIDVIEADPDAFGDQSAHAPLQPRRELPRWVVAAGLLVVAAIGITAAIWRPWEHPPKWRTFPPAAAPVSALTDQLVLDLPTSHVTSLELGRDVADDEPTPIGWVFAEPGGSYESDQWALFHARFSTGGREAAPSKSTDFVQGLQAKVRRVRVRTTVTWGPVDGKYLDTETNLMGKAEALAFADAVGVVDGMPAIEHSYSLGALQPLGDVKTLARVQVLASHLAGEPVLNAVSPTVLTYAGDTGSVLAASIDATPDALEMAGFYFGDGEHITVHGLPALLFHTRHLGTIVAWYEGDRLVTVSGQETDAALIRLAESTRPATRVEWSEVLDATRPVEVGTATHDQTTINTGTTQDGTGWWATVTPGNPMVICVHYGPTTQSIASCIFTTPLVPAEHIVELEALDTRFAVVVAPDAAQVLRVTDAAGTVTDFAPVPVTDTTWAIAAEVDAGSSYVLVDPAG